MENKSQKTIQGHGTESWFARRVISNIPTFAAVDSFKQTITQKYQTQHPHVRCMKN